MGPSGQIDETVSLRQLSGCAVHSGRSKSSEAFDSQCSPEKIVQFFKCSRKTCDFTCDDKESFYFHLLTHNEDEEEDVCIYCERMFVIENLALHMEAQHGNRRFQCTRCFYRGCTRAHLIVHCLKQHHTQLVSGVACPRMPRAFMPDIKARARTLLYRCSLCTFRTFLRDDFEHHLSNAHPESSTGSDNCCKNSSEVISVGDNMGAIRRLHCLYCRQPNAYQTSDAVSELHTFSAGELIMHLDEQHGLGSQMTCLYCGEALSSQDEALSHMTEIHSDWPINILDRTKRSSHGISTGTLSQFQTVVSRDMDTTVITTTAGSKFSPLVKGRHSPPHVKRESNESSKGPVKKYSAAPRSVQEKRQRKLRLSLSRPSTDDFLSRPSSSSTNVVSHKMTSRPRNAFKSTALYRSMDGNQILNIDETSEAARTPSEYPLVSLRCAACIPSTKDYGSHEALALHMREMHNVYYICQCCFHGEEKFRDIQAHVAQCKDATELDIVTLKNGILKTSSKVRFSHKERQPQNACTSTGCITTHRSELRACEAMHNINKSNRNEDSLKHNEYYTKLNDMKKNGLQPCHSNTGGKEKVPYTTSELDQINIVSHVNRKRERQGQVVSFYGQPVEPVSANVVVIYNGERMPFSKFDQLVLKGFPQVKRCSEEELLKWGAI